MGNMFNGFPEGGLEEGRVYVYDVDPEKLERIRVNHFEGAKNAGCERGRVCADEDGGATAHEG